MSSTTVCTLEVSVPNLRPGSIVVSCGRALYLERELPTMRGRRLWTYTRHMPDGTVCGRGHLDLREDSAATVVCVTLDGAVVTP